MVCQLCYTIEFWTLKKNHFILKRQKKLELNQTLIINIKLKNSIASVADHGQSKQILTRACSSVPILQVDIISESPEGDLSNYQSNGEFDLVDFSAKRNVQNYSCCPEPYPDITYTIRLRRRPMFYVFNLILPCILINGIGG